jgi:CheY-like chemotaxis protein
LTLAGYEVAAAANGREALQYLRLNPEPCLVLLDLMMPVMSGWQFRAEQRQDPELASLPVVVMTATRSLEQAAIDADDLIRKPVELHQLLTTIRRYATPAPPPLDDFDDDEKTQPRGATVDDDDEGAEGTVSRGLDTSDSSPTNV